MSEENRQKVLRAPTLNKSSALFSSEGLSFNSTTGFIDLPFKRDVVGNIETVTLLGGEHNVQKYRVIFFDINNRQLDEYVLEIGSNVSISVDNVAALRIVFLETSDQKHIRGVKLSIRGCFFKIPFLKTKKPVPVRTTKPPGYCNAIELMEKRNSKRLLRRIGGSIDLPQIFNASVIAAPAQNDSELPFYILEFNGNIFIRNIQRVAILSKNHQVKRIRIELHNKRQQLLKRVDLSLDGETDKTALYSPIYPIHVKYLKVTILKGKPTKAVQWSIVGCFDRIKKIKTVVKTLKYVWWTGLLVSSALLL